jgi:HAD superfamily hydrolase (TIGR01509 family)
MAHDRLLGTAHVSPSGAVLFDVDGTLVDTNYLHVFSWMGAFHAVGYPVDGVAVHRAIGMGAPQLIERLVGSAAARRLADQVKDQHTIRYRETFPLMRPFDGAAGLLRRVAGRAAVVLATSAGPEELSALRRVLDADDAITTVTAAADVDQAKPEPDLIEVALEKARVPADRAVMVGDTVWDIEAAGRAGVACVGVMSGGISRAELSDAGAVAVYRDVADLLQNLERSPLEAVLAAESGR